MIQIIFETSMAKIKLIDTITLRYSSKLWRIMLPVSAVLFLVIPNLIVIISAALLLRKARKAVTQKKKELKWQGVTTVVVTAVVYTVSYLPFNLYFTLEPHLEKNPRSFGPFSIHFYRVANGFIILNVLSNFFCVQSDGG